MKVGPTSGPVEDTFDQGFGVAVAKTPDSLSVTRTPIYEAPRRIDFTPGTLPGLVVNVPKSAQVGGSHYKNCKIQPIDYILENGLGFCEANVVKYVTRWRAKGGIADLEKAKHYLDLLIASEAK